MAAGYEDDWSDSDDDMGSDVETSVQLGIPDGPLKSPSDLLDAAVSRIGGHPAFLTSPEPPFPSALCKNCSSPMELLVQVWCPLESSPSDRALYVWGCARGICQRLEGSVRAWRGLRYNEGYAAKLAKKQARQREKELAQAKAAEDEEKRKQAAKTNPFSMKSTNAPNPFGLGAQVFGEPSSPPAEGIDDKDEKAGDEDEDTSDASSPPEEEDDEDIVSALAATTLETSEWKTAPSYGSLYMSTVAEYLPPAPKPKIPQNVQVEENASAKPNEGTWALEGYENSLEVDHIFERFTKRIGYEGEQCIRYELGGIPMPFADDDVFKRLFPAPPAPNLPVTRPDSMVVPPQKRTYDPSTISQCPHCKGKRVFECQLMPNLINVLKVPGTPEGVKQTTDEERRKEVEKALKGSGNVEHAGMEWGTCMVFSCENDCCTEKGAPSKSCWREEVVLVQWDN